MKAVTTKLKFKGDTKTSLKLDPLFCGILDLIIIKLLIFSWCVFYFCNELFYTLIIYFKVEW